MELKVILIIAIVAAITISAQARRGQNERGNERRNDRERGQGRLGLRQGSDRPTQMDGPRSGRRGQGQAEDGQVIEDGPGRFSGRRQPGRGPRGHRVPSHNKTEENPFGQHNDSIEEDGRPHPRHHHRRHHHRRHNETEDHHRNKTEDGDQDRPEMRPFRFNPFGRKPFGDRPFGRRNRTEEGHPRRDGHRRPHGNRGHWNKNEDEEETTTIPSSAGDEEVEVDINEIDNDMNN